MPDHKEIRTVSFSQLSEECFTTQTTSTGHRVAPDLDLQEFQGQLPQYFITLLHLASEKNLDLEDFGHDFKISKDDTESTDAEDLEENAIKEEEMLA